MKKQRKKPGRKPLSWDKKRSMITITIKNINLDKIDGFMQQNGIENKSAMIDKIIEDFFIKQKLI